MTVAGVDLPWIAPLVVGGLALGWLSWRASLGLLGLWGIPDALFARRLVRKGELPFRLEIHDFQGPTDRAPVFRWQPENNPVTSPTLTHLHHLAATALLAWMASVACSAFGITAGGLGAFLLLFSPAYVVLLLLAWRAPQRLKLAQQCYEENASRTFSCVYPLDAFNTREMLSHIQAIKSAAHHVPGDFRHIRVNFIDYLTHEAGKSFLLGEDSTTLLRRFSDILVQAEIDLQTIALLDACFADVYSALSAETRCLKAQRSHGFAIYAAAFEAQDAGRWVAAVFHEPGVTYIRKARDTMERMFHEIQRLRLIDDISSARLATLSDASLAGSRQFPTDARQAAMPAAR